jgi:hypothetical protein
MSSYHQMGHDSWNLVSEEALTSFGGLVLSPVNDSPEQVRERLASLGTRRDHLDIILDPQFYKPKSDRGSLTDWLHIDNNFDTADLGNMGWWTERCHRLVEQGEQIGVTAIASPAAIPRAFDVAYYDWVIECAEALQTLLDGRKTSALITALIHVPELAQRGTADRIASVLTRSRISRVYLVFVDDGAPRAQRTDSEALAGAMSLIRTLESARSRVLVAFSGLDMLLWKSAGATDVATGKFFNLRRFVPGRWDDPAEGGRVLPYWTDGEFIAWFREEDVRLLLRLGLLDRERAGVNPYSQEILTLLDRRSGEPWVRLGWRQYMYWFCQWEAEIGSGKVDVRDMLEHADQLWLNLEERRVRLFERPNNGEWIRAWLNAFLL